jgi:N-dimethylarginine dimethylaminohydrolase
MKLLMCRPDYYDIEYEINPWMDINQQSNQALAQREWNDLYQTLQKAGAKIELVPGVRGWPDMVFTANAGLFYKNKIILSHFKHKERQGETPYYRAWFEKAGFDLIATDSFAYEGAGDTLLAGEKIFAGFGFRTDREFYKSADFFDQDKLIYCELVDPYFYHIDTCFCPITEKLAIWYPEAFSASSQKNMAAHIELIPVLKDEAKHFACNAVVLDKQIVLPKGCPTLATELQKRGFITHICDMSEYLKSGGACKCLTLRID